MKILIDCTLAELYEELAPYNQPKFAAGQIYGWLNKGRGFDEMTDVSKEFRSLLKQNYYALGAEIVEKFVGRDQTAKYLFRLTDGNIIEGVLMGYKHGNTLCVSTQVGCRMGCTFCASTLGGLVRNLTAGEILSQVVLANRDVGSKSRGVTNIVLMGSGEPLDNYDNVVKFLRLVSGKEGLNVSCRNISLSTSGVVKNMLRLAGENLPVNLTVSLHAATQEKRAAIMPVAKANKLPDVINAAKNYFEKTGRRIIFEYTLIEGENDGFSDAEALSTLMRGMAAHVNIIRLNPVKESAHKPTTDKKAYAFAEKLTSLGVSATVRRQMGADIEGACGQLRRKYIGQRGGT